MSDGLSGLGQQLDPIDKKQRLTLDADIATVCQHWKKMANVGQIVFEGEGLLQQSYGGPADPALFPGLIRPADAERKIRFARGQDFIERPFQYPFAGKPIVVVAESVDSELLRQLRLSLSRL